MKQLTNVLCSLTCLLLLFVFSCSLCNPFTWPHIFCNVPYPPSTPSAVLCLVVQLCPTLCGPMDCSPPGSSVRGILRARILEWVAMLSSRKSSPPGDGTQTSCVSCIGGQILYCLSHEGSPDRYRDKKAMSLTLRDLQSRDTSMSAGN